MDEGQVALVGPKYWSTRGENRAVTAAGASPHNPRSWFPHTPDPGRSARISTVSSTVDLPRFELAHGSAQRLDGFVDIGQESQTHRRSPLEGPRARFPSP